MNLSIPRLSARVAVMALMAAAICLPAALAQMGTNPNYVADTERQQQQTQLSKQQQLNTSEAKNQKIDKKENNAYKAYYNTSPQDVDKRIQLGQGFVQKYPSGPYTEVVYAGLVQAYYVKQDWKDMFASSDKALALNPENVDVLITTGWVIPHIYDPNAPDADKLLSKAEDYEKRALQDLSTMTTPAGETDAQFVAMKAEKAREAHSGLGLVYFRRQDFENSAKELALATQGTPNPDPTDLYALGAALQNMQQLGSAAKAFDQCAQISGSLQDECKQKADAAHKLAAQAK